MAYTLRMRTTISPRQQWQLWKLFCRHWGSSVWHSRRANERGGGGELAHQKPFTGEASVKHSFKRQLHRKLDPGQPKFDT